MSDLEEEGNGPAHTTDLGLMKVKSSMPKATTPVPRVPLKLSKYETEIGHKDAQLLKSPSPISEENRVSRVKRRTTNLNYA